MTEPWQIIIVAMLVSVVAPVILAQMTNRARRSEKHEDWARLDAVAALAKVANEAAVASQASIRDDLKTIHTLVNSQMTAAIQSEFDANTRELVTLKELIDLKRSNGREPTADVIGTVSAMESKVAELRVTLDERQRQQRLIDAQTMAARTAALNEDK